VKAPLLASNRLGVVKQFTAKTVDFGASDTPLTAEELQADPGGHMKS